MRFLAWFLTIIFALAGLALRADGGFGVGPDLGPLAPILAKGAFLLAALACPFLWSLLPGPISMRGKTRFMLALALIIGAPLILPWALSQSVTAY